MLKQKRVAITGGAGFIGSNLAESLVKNNQVVIIDDLSTGNLENIRHFIINENCIFVKGSVLDKELLETTFQGIDFIFHLAAIPNVAGSIIDPISTNEVNINGTLNVLVSARNNKVNKVVFASSSAVYGNTGILPNRENSFPDLQSPYALTKLAGEYYCDVFSKLYGLPTVCLRYFNVYGPRQNPNSKYASVIPSFISSVFNNKYPVIYGDGGQKRDFTFVEDVVQANILAAESEITGVINIGTSSSSTINELAKVIIKLSGRNIHPIYEEARPGEVRESLADITLARSLGYNPRYTLENGLRETIKFTLVRNLKN